MKYFQIQILTTGCLCCGDQTVLHLPSPCMLAVAQLLRCGGELTELVVWVGRCHCSQSAGQTAFQGLFTFPYVSEAGILITVLT
jgi:hypothetical protein